VVADGKLPQYSRILLLLLCILAANGFVPGGRGTATHKITHITQNNSITQNNTITQNKTHHTK
jgi:hypothetical protein